MSWGPCEACSSPDVLVRVHDVALGEAGPLTLACERCGVDVYVPAEATARSRIGAVRAIVRDHTAARIDGYLVDAVTAGLLVAVYDAISPAHRERFGQVPLEKLVELGWRHAR